MRTKERLIDIDNYLDEHYPKEGSRACADALNEKVGYIQSRVQMRKMFRENPKNKKRKKKESAVVAVLSGKVAAKNREIAELWELLKRERDQNKELRIENTRLITEKVKARRKHAEASV